MSEPTAEPLIVDGKQRVIARYNGHSITEAEAEEVKAKFRSIYGVDVMVFGKDWDIFNPGPPARTDVTINVSGFKGSEMELAAEIKKSIRNAMKRGDGR